MSGVSISSSTSNALEAFSLMSFEQCAKQIHKVIRTSLRDYARTIELFRELEDAEHEKATHDQAESYRSVIPMVMRIGSAVFGALNIGVGICPQAAKHSYDWLVDRCPLVPEGLFASFHTPVGFEYMKLGKFLSEKLAVGDGLCRTGLDIFNTYQQADRAEIEGRLQKTRELSDRRAREANERRAESDELLQLLQQMNREIADAIRAIARA